MTRTPLAQRLTDIIAPAVESLGLALWGVETASAGSRMLLRVYIDAPATPTSPTVTDAPEAAPDESTEPAEASAEVSPDNAPGVTVDHCARVSRHLGALFDAEDIIPGAYVLEVSSPGLERRFFAPMQMSGYLGREVEVRLNLPQDGRRRLKGALASVEGDRITIAEDKGEMTVRWELVKQAHLVHEFPVAQKPGQA